MYNSSRKRSYGQAMIPASVCLWFHCLGTQNSKVPPSCARRGMHASSQQHIIAVDANRSVITNLIGRCKHVEWPGRREFPLDCSRWRPAEAGDGQQQESWPTQKMVIMSEFCLQQSSWNTDRSSTTVFLHHVLVEYWSNNLCELPLINPLSITILFLHYIFEFHPFFVGFVALDLSLTNFQTNFYICRFMRLSVAFYMW